MNPTQDQINDWITRASSSDAPNTIIEFSIEHFVNAPLGHLKRFVLEMKVQIDRWDLIMEYLFIHPFMQEMILSHLGDAVNMPITEQQVPNIWGCQIIANEYIPEDMLIGFYDIKEDILLHYKDRNVVLGKLNIKMLNKTNQMKAFW